MAPTSRDTWPEMTGWREPERLFSLAEVAVPDAWHTDAVAGLVAAAAALILAGYGVLRQLRRDIRVVRRRPGEALP